MPRVSNQVQDRVKGLYALMATVAADRAIQKIKFGDADAAESWAGVTERWLIRSGAHAARYTFKQPSV